MNKKYYFIFLIIIFCMSFSVVYAANDKLPKKVISVVYDDSMSMSLSSSTIHSRYILQLITSYLEIDDELNVVKMSKALGNIEINLTPYRREPFMWDFEKYEHRDIDGPSAVNTALEWLSNKINRNSNSIYRLIIISDAPFIDVYKKDIERYKYEFDNYFTGLDYEIIYLNIGDSSNTRISGINYIEVGNSFTKYNNLLEDLKFAQNALTEDYIEIEKTTNETIKMTVKTPLERLNILIQNVDNDLWSITEVKNNKKIYSIFNGYNSVPDFYEYDIDSSMQSLKSSMVDMYRLQFEPGEYLFEFEFPIELDDVIFLCEKDMNISNGNSSNDVGNNNTKTNNIEAKLSFIDENNIISKNGDDYLVSDWLINVKCELYDADNGAKLSKNQFPNSIEVKAKDDKYTYRLTFNEKDNAYYGPVAIWNDNVGNIVYAEVKVSETETIKSNILTVKVKDYKIDKEKIEIPYVKDNEYEFVDAVLIIDKKVSNTEEQVKKNVKLLNVPDGVAIEYDGKMYKNNEEFTTLMPSNEIMIFKFYANYEYQEIYSKEMTVEVERSIRGDGENNFSEAQLTKLSIEVVPKNKPIKLVLNKFSEQIQIEYNFSDEYINVFEYEFYIEKNEEDNSSKTFEIELINVPEGIIFEYDKVQYKNNDKIPIIIDYSKMYNLKICTNKNFRETEDTNIILKLGSYSLENKIIWNTTERDEENILISPENCLIRILNKNNDNEIDVQNENLELEIARIKSGDALNVIEIIKLENIKSIENNSSFLNGFTYEIEKDDTNDILKLRFKPNLFYLIKGNKSNVELKMKFDTAEEYISYNQEITFINIDKMVILKPCINLCIIFVIFMGYFIKNKFDGNAQIIITEGGDSMVYGLTPNFITLIIPYISHKTKVGMLEITANKKSKIICSLQDYNVKKINNIPLKEYIKTNLFNERKFVMEKNKTSIVINTYDGEQMYEYSNGSEYEIDDGLDNILDYNDDYEI